MNPESDETASLSSADDARPPFPPPMPPAAELERRTVKAHVTLTVVMWCLWIPLVLSIFLDGLIGMLQQGVPRPPSGRQVTVLAVIGLLQLGLAAFLRHQFFRVWISPTRLDPGSGQAVSLGIFGTLVIFCLIRCVETYGFVLLLTSCSWPLYLSFSIPSLLCFIYMLPPLVLRWRA